MDSWFLDNPEHNSPLDVGEAKPWVYGATIYSQILSIVIFLVILMVGITQNVFVNLAIAGIVGFVIYSVFQRAAFEEYEEAWRNS